MKKGISLVSLIVVIIVMIILAGTVIVQISNSSEFVAFNTFAIEIFDIQNAVDEYYYRYGKYPTGDEYSLDTTDIETKSISQFASEIITNDTISFKLIDLSIIGINNTEYGTGEELDKYVISEPTGKVYYLNGIEYEGKIYYTLTEEVYAVIGSTNNRGFVSTRDVKVHDVIFTPSALEATNEPITVLVKVPVDAIINEIVVTEGKSIGSEITQGIYKAVMINEDSTNKEGNYTITVNYTYNEVTIDATYQVTTFDNTVPNLSVTESENGNIKTVSITASDSSGIKLIKYEDEYISDKSYFSNYGTVVVNNQFVIPSDGWYTIWVQDNAGNITTLDNMPESWRANVIKIVDDVPIPKGFVASQATGENTKMGGLVIYEGTEEVTDDNVETAWTTRNQYVWVPVEDFDMLFKRRNSGLNDTTGKAVVISNVLGINQWEVELNESTNLPNEIQSTTDYITSATLAEAQAMYASVKEYEGFYVARYEAGIASQRTSNTTLTTSANVHSKMNKIPYTYIPWGVSTADDAGGAVSIARGIYTKTDTNYGVVSTLMYGVQWDATMQWWLSTKAVQSIKNSTNYGNYSDKVINSLSELNEGAQIAIYNTSSEILGSYVPRESATLTYPKTSGICWALSTGALKAAKVNNIYDMAGNVLEWTMEGSSSNYRTRFGGYFNSAGNSTGYPVAIRSNGNPNGAYLGIGFRTALYIKQ